MSSMINIPLLERRVIDRPTEVERRGNSGRADT